MSLHLKVARHRRQAKCWLWNYFLQKFYCYWSFWFTFMNQIMSLKMVNEILEISQEVLSLWPSDVIWRLMSGSTMDQVIPCCLTAPSHYLNQCWLIISEVVWLHLRAFSLEMLKISILDMSLKMTNLRFHSNLPGVSELTVPMGLRGGAKGVKTDQVLNPRVHAPQLSTVGVQRVSGINRAKEKEVACHRRLKSPIYGWSIMSLVIGKSFKFCEHIEAEAKWLPFCRWHIQMYFLEWKLYFDSIFTKFVCNSIIDQ